MSLNGSSSKDPVINAAITDRTTSVLRILSQCKGSKNGKTQMMYICDLLNAHLMLTPKYHPEIAGRGVEYGWGYSKLRFRRDFNDAIPVNLKRNIVQLLDRGVLTTDRIRKFARKAREYKLTYALILYIGDEDSTGTKGNDHIEHVTKLFKTHRSAMDSDYGFISNS